MESKQYPFFFIGSCSSHLLSGWEWGKGKQTCCTPPPPPPTQQPSCRLCCNLHYSQLSLNVRIYSVLPLVNLSLQHNYLRLYKCTTWYSVPHVHVNVMHSVVYEWVLCFKNGRIRFWPVEVLPTWQVHVIKSFVNSILSPMIYCILLTETEEGVK